MPKAYAQRNQHLEDLVQWIEGQLKLMKDGEAFPSDRALAESFAMSSTTVRTVLRRYRDAGRVVRIRGKGTFTPGTPSDNFPKPVRPLSSVESIARNFAESIARGEIPAGHTLPAIKFVCKQFRVSPPSVIGAYRKLQETGLVIRMGKSYRVGGLVLRSGNSPRREAHLILHPEDSLMTVFRENLMARAYERMERELLANGYRLRYERADGVRSLLKRLSSGRERSNGLILYGFGRQRCDAMGPDLIALLEWARRFGTPVLVDWFIGTRHPALKSASMVSRGHLLTSIARKLAQFFLAINCPGALLFFDEHRGKKYRWGITPLLRIRAEIKRLNRGFACRFAIRSIANDQDPKGFFERLVSALSLGEIEKSMSKHESVPAETFLRESAVFRNFSELHRQNGLPNMWVFMTSEEAAEACAWAAGCGVSIPGELHVLCLQSEPGDSHRGITTCEPDWDTIGYLMAHVIIGDVPIKKTGKGLVATSACLFQRQTTT